MLENFLNQFYERISFKYGEGFKEKAFAKLFLPNAVLMEKVEKEYIQKSVREHIEEFNSVIAEYPCLFVRGFNEKQLEYSFIENEDCILVSSKYEKTYYRNEEEVVEQGINNMIIVKHEGLLKIASIIW